VQRTCHCSDAHAFIKSSHNTFNYTFNIDAPLDARDIDQEQKGGALIKMRAPMGWPRLRQKAHNSWRRARNHANGDPCVIDRAIARYDYAANIAPTVVRVALARHRATRYSQL
jgi:hypothetical protein